MVVRSPNNGRSRKVAPVNLFNPSLRSRHASLHFDGLADVVVIVGDVITVAAVVGVDSGDVVQRLHY